MNAMRIKYGALDYIKAHSGLDQHRDYLGMSAIGRCPLQLYRQFVDGRGTLTDRAHLNCYSGYFFERQVREVLVNCGAAIERSRELVAPFDTRFRGHIDGETVDGLLLEIKSMNTRRFDELKESHRLPREYADQVQAYMRYGPYDMAMVVTVCRESFDLFVLAIDRDDAAGAVLERKAMAVLKAIDDRTPPRCTCGRCEAGYVARQTGHTVKEA